MSQLYAEPMKLLKNLYSTITQWGEGESRTLWDWRRHDAASRPQSPNLGLKMFYFFADLKPAYIEFLVKRNLRKYG